MIDHSVKALSPAFCAALTADRKARCYAAGTNLFQASERSRGVYVVESGDVELFQTAKCGELVSMETVGSGSVIGLNEAVSGSPHKLTAIAKTETRVLFVDRHELLQILRQEPVFCMQLVRMLSEDLHVLYRKCQNNSGVARSGRTPSQVETPRTTRPD